MRPSTYGHTSFNGQSPYNQNIIKIKVNTKNNNFKNNKIIIKTMIGHSLSTYNIRGKTKININITSIEDKNSSRQNSVFYQTGPKRRQIQD
jgi:hypothetical protein